MQAMDITVVNIQEEFDTYGITIANNEILQRCLELCAAYNITAENIAVSWLVYASNNHCDGITLQNIDDFEKESLTNVKSKNKKSIKIYDASNIHFVCQDEGLLSAYGVPCSPNRRKNGSSSLHSQHTPIARKGGNRTSQLASPRVGVTNGGTPSQRYASRTNSGTVVTSYGRELLKQGEPSVQHVKVDSLSFGIEGVLNSNRKYMFEKMRDAAEALDYELCCLADQMLQLIGEKNWTQIKHINHNSSWYVGRVHCDSVGRLNAASLVLEGSTEDCGGDTVRLDVSMVNNYALFPGQVIAVKGVNPTGDKLIASEILTGVSPPKPSLPVDIPDSGINLLIACGPFTTSDNLLFEPLYDLLSQLLQEPPHILLLLGPFLPSSHKLLQEHAHEVTYDAMFRGHIEAILTQLKGTLTEVYIMSSCQDLCTPLVFPTPPMHLQPPLGGGNIHFIADPTLLCIGGAVLAVTSTDTIMHLSKEEISRLQQSGDRFGRLCQHLLQQQSIYPLMPPPLELPLSNDARASFANLNVAPHVIVIPSDFRAFVKAIGDTVIVNPEKLTKGAVGGCFANLQLLPKKMAEEGKGVDVRVKVTKV